MLLEHDNIFEKSLSISSNLMTTMTISGYYNESPRGITVTSIVLYLTEAIAYFVSNLYMYNNVYSDFVCSYHV